MGARYTVTRVTTALNTAQDIMTITAPAGRSLIIHSIAIGGQVAATGAANEVGVYRSTGGVTPTAITPQPLNVDFAAASFTAAGGWATHPTLGVVLNRLSVNGVNGFDTTRRPGAAPIEVPGGGQISVRSVSGTSAVTVVAEVEQV